MKSDNSDDPVMGHLLFEFLGPLVAVLEFGIAHGDAGEGRYGFGDEDIAADHRAGADHGFATQDRRAGIHRHVVEQRWMALGAAQHLTATGRKRTERDALIDLHSFADHRGFTNHHAGTMIDEEIFADGGTRANINAGDAVGVFAHHARNQRNAAQVQFVGDAR